MFGAHELQGKQVVICRYRLAIGPARVRVEPVVNGFAVLIKGPVSRQHRDGVQRVGMKVYQRQRIGAQIVGKAAIGIRADQAQSEWKGRDKTAKTTAAHRLR